MADWKAEVRKTSYGGSNPSLTSKRFSISNLSRITFIILVSEDLLSCIRESLLT